MKTKRAGIFILISNKKTLNKNITRDKVIYTDKEVIFIKRM